MNNLEKSLVEFSKSNEYQRCSNFMRNSPPIDRCDILMNVNLKNEGRGPSLCSIKIPSKNLNLSMTNLMNRRLESYKQF
jgi:hypothetical protein